ncbi:MAG: mechanosensitive ion channel family protein [Acidimicrobiia bacterium]
MDEASQDHSYLYELARELGLSDFWAQTAEVLLRPVQILLIAVVAMVTTRLGGRVVRRSVQRLVARSTARAGATAAATNRADTLAGVAASLVRVAVWTIAFLLILDTLGINPGPLLAGASIVGVAVGFGAQYLVRDFLSGFFVLAEDQFAVGDVITVADVTGAVEEVNLRITRLRATDGTVWFVPNGEIRKVGNSAKEWAVALVDVTIPAGADVGAATAAITEEMAAVADDESLADAVLGPPEVLGIESMGTDGFTVRVSVKTRPGQRSRVARQIRARIGSRLRDDGLAPLRQTTPAAEEG